MSGQARITKVLIADDDEDDREIIVRLLNNMDGVKLVRSVENGREVIEFLNTLDRKDEFPHLIILDHNMPMMNGAETLGVIKSSDRFSDINVVIYSTYSDRSLRERCHALGASMVLTKPAGMKEYEQSIREFLKLVG